MNTYTPNPAHTLYCVLLFAICAVVLSYAETPIMLALGISIGAVGLIVLGWMVIVAMWQARADYIHALARLAQALNDAPRPTGTTNVTVTEPTDNSGPFTTTKLFSLPATESQLRTLASGLLDGISFSERNWAGKGKPFSSPKFRQLQDDLLKRGMIEPVSVSDPRQGYKLTRGGEALMRSYQQPPSPSPLPQQA